MLNKWLASNVSGKGKYIQGNVYNQMKETFIKKVINYEFDGIRFK